MLINKDFFNMIYNWLAAMPTANQKAGLMILVN